MNRRESYDADFEWGIRGIEALAPSADVMIIVDVLSFSTSVSVAVERGAAVIPYRFEYESAKAFAIERDAVLALQRGDATSENPYSLSPASLKNLGAGVRLVLPSPNGSTCCARASELGVNQVLAGSLRNAKATAVAAKSLGGRIAVIAAGEQWEDGTLRPAVEDYLGAGTILSLISPRCPSPEAAIAMWSYEAAADRIKDVISNCVSAGELLERGYGQDVEASLELNVSTVAAMLRGSEICAYSIEPGQRAR